MPVSFESSPAYLHNPGSGGSGSVRTGVKSANTGAPYRRGLSSDLNARPGKAPNRPTQSIWKNSWKLRYVPNGLRTLNRSCTKASVHFSSVSSLTPVALETFVKRKRTRTDKKQAGEVIEKGKEPPTQQGRMRSEGKTVLKGGVWTQDDKLSEN